MVRRAACAALLLSILVIGATERASAAATPPKAAVPLQEFASDHVNGRIWNAYNHTADAGGPPIMATPAALYLADQGMAHVYAQAANGDLVEFVSDHLNGRTWNAYDLSAEAGGPPIAATPSALYLADQGMAHVYAQAANGDLVEFVSDHLNGRTWNAYDLSASAGGGPVAGSPSALDVADQGVVHVYVRRAADNDLVEYVSDHLNGRTWNVYDQTVDAGGTVVAGSPVAVYVEEQGVVHVYVRRSDNDLVEYVSDHLNGRTWNVYDLSASTGGPSLGTDPSALDVAGVVHVFVGGPVPMGGLVIFNTSTVPDAPYGPGDNVVALSFDDGPSPVYTPQILSILEQYHVPASFEIVGSLGAANTGLLQQEAGGGFGLVNHTWDHVDLTKTSPAGWVSEVDNTDALITSVTHRPVACLRPPYGYTNAGVVSQLAQRGLAELMWDVDPSDYLQPGSSVIAQRVLGALHPGAIVIMHDGGGNRSQTVAALPAIINGARAAGYTFVEVCG